LCKSTKEIYGDTVLDEMSTGFVIENAAKAVYKKHYVKVMDAFLSYFSSDTI